MRHTKIVDKQCNYKRCTYRRMKRRKYCEKHVQLFIDKEAGEQPIMQTISDAMRRPEPLVLKSIPEIKIKADPPTKKQRRIIELITNFIFTVQDESNR